MEAGNLPEGIRRIEFREFSPEFENGGEILRKYCSSCVGGKSCGMQRGLREAMGENYPLWFEAHVPVRVTQEGDWMDFRAKTHVFCEEYISPQQNLPGIPKERIDGITRLLEIIGRE